MKSYIGYLVTRVNYDATGRPITALIEKPNPDSRSNLPLDSKTVMVPSFLKELEELVSVVEGAKSIREQINTTTHLQNRT